MKSKFNRTVSDLVQLKTILLGKSYKDISIILNVSESFIQKVHSHNYAQHYNLEHLFLLSDYWNININEFIPSLRTLKFINTYRSEEEIKQILDDITLDLFERKNNNE